MTPQELLTTWTELTGERWRAGLVPCIVMQQAAEFTRAGFTVEELKLVINYTRKQISRGEGGFNAQSLLWRVMAADNWQRFQERLELAKASKKRRIYVVEEEPKERENFNPETIRKQIEENQAFRRRLIRGDAA